MSALLTNLLTALPTVVIGCIALYIAYQQWQTNHRKLELDLYDRRLRLYQATTKYISVVLADFKPKLEDLFEFRRETAEAHFLYGRDITAYLDELYRHGVDLHRWAEEYRDYTQPTPPHYDHKKVTDGMHQEERWFVDQHKEALRRFKSYLNLSGRAHPRRATRGSC